MSAAVGPEAMYARPGHPGLQHPAERAEEGAAHPLDDPPDADEQGRDEQAEQRPDHPEDRHRGVHAEQLALVGLEAAAQPPADEQPDHGDHGQHLPRHPAGPAGEVRQTEGPVGPADTEGYGAWVISTAVLFHVAITVICLLKGKVIMGLAGLPAPIFSYVGAFRLAKPESFWARRFCGEKKLARATKRHAKFEGRRLALRDRLFAG